jgi:hypothetical protein
MKNKQMEDTKESLDELDTEFYLREKEHKEW